MDCSSVWVGTWLWRSGHPREFGFLSSAPSSRGPWVTMGQVEGVSLTVVHRGSQNRASFTSASSRVAQGRPRPWLGSVSKAKCCSFWCLLPQTT